MGRSHVFDRNAVPCDLSGNPILRITFPPPPRMFSTTETLLLTDQTARIGHAYHPPLMLPSRTFGHSPITLTTTSINFIKYRKEKHWLLKDEYMEWWVYFFCMLFFIYMTPIFIYDHYSIYVPDTVYRWSSGYVWFCLVSALFTLMLIMDYLETEIRDVMPLNCRGVRYKESPIQFIYFCFFILLLIWTNFFTNYTTTLRIIITLSSYGIFAINSAFLIFLGN